MLSYNTQHLYALIEIVIQGITGENFVLFGGSLMLYLSRYRPELSYGIVDTDDDVEEIVSRDELRTAVMTYGLSIEGMSVSPGKHGPFVQFAQPYQDSRYVTTLMTKTRLVYGVEVRVWRDEVTYVLFNTDITPAGTAIRLSDYGSRFCGYSVVKWTIHRPDNDATIILDDNIKIIDKSPKMSEWGVRYDVRELSNSSVVECMYRELVKGTPTEYKFWDSWILDNPKRFHRWQCAGMLNSVVADDDDFVVELKQSEDYCEISDFLGKAYRAEFESLANTDVSKTFFTSMSAFDFVGFVTDFFEDGVSKFASVLDYEALHKNCGKFTQMLKLVSTINSHTLNRFENYFNHFVVPEDMKQVFVTFCHNTITGLINYCDTCGMPLEG